MDPRILPFARLAIPSHVAWRRVDQDLVLFDGRDGSYHALNSVASAIWRAVDEGLGGEAITEALALRYDAPAAEIAEELRDFLAIAVDRGFLTVREEP
jgi:hypothetical protein